MSIRARRALLAAVLATGLAVLATGLMVRPAFAQSGTPAPGDRLPVTIVGAPAGDTLTAQMNDGHLETIRLIGLDAPEPDAPGQSARCFAAESAAQTGSLAIGHHAELELDLAARDRHGRLLGYLWLPGQDVSLNQQLLSNGYATSLTVAPNTAYTDDLERAARTAQIRKRGIWAACAVGELPTVATDYPAGEVAVSSGSPPSVQIRLGTERTASSSQMTIAVAAEGGQGIDRIVVGSDRDDDPDFGAERQISCAGQALCSDAWTVHPNHLGVYQVSARAEDATGQAAEATVSLNVVGRWQTIATRVADLRPSASTSPTPASSPADDSAAPLPSGACPAGFPIKARTADDGSRHSYRADGIDDGTMLAERCFATEDAASAAGYPPISP
jgi:endonuclease YncB( thermonuclease family)